MGRRGCRGGGQGTTLSHTTVLQAAQGTPAAAPPRARPCRGVSGPPLAPPGAPDASTQRSFSTLRLEEDAAQGRDLALQSLSALNSAAGVKLKLEGKKCSIQTVDASAATEQQVARSSERRSSVEGQEALPEASCPDLDSFLLGTAVSEPSQSQIDR